MARDIAETIKRIRKVEGTVSLGTVYSSKYSGGGDSAVADGIRGSYEFTDGRWQGYEGCDFIARYIRIHAHNRGVCPAWHPGAGEKAWIFLDELGVQ